MRDNRQKTEVRRQKSESGRLNSDDKAQSHRGVIRIEGKAWDEIISWAEREYPYEGCGLLVGVLSPVKEVRRFVPVNNLLRQEGQSKTVHHDAAKSLLGERAANDGHYEFAMDPVRMNEIESKAMKEGLDVIGLIHTHPDHPARPSAIDAAQPMLSSWSNLIVSVAKGKFVECRSWFRNNEAESFQEEALEIKTGNDRIRQVDSETGKD